nr:group IIE secretory phospholipase A2-like [Pogona vitticeps]
MRMKYSLGLPLLSLCVLSSASGNLIQFADMIRQVTGRLPSLFYNGYGCYCGLGGSGQPLDDTDWCCQAHDCCYEKMSSLGCDPKMEIFSYSIRKGAVVCHGKTLCQRMICECDKTASLCFRTASASYRVRNMFYPNILCKGARPPC